MNDNIHIENVLILVNVILVLYLVYCYSNRAIERFHEDGTYPRNQPHNHYDDIGHYDNNTGCIIDSANNCVIDEQTTPVEDSQ
jgi:hypothetical protein